MEQLKEHVLCGAVIMPPKVINDQARVLHWQLSQLLQENDPLVNFQGIPHITLFHGIVSKKELKSLGEWLAETATKNPVIQAKFKEQLRITHKEYITWDLEPNEQVTSLQQQAIDYFNINNKVIRIPRSALETGKVSDDQMQQIHQGGAYWTDQEYRPHVTLVYGAKHVQQYENAIKNSKINRQEAVTLPGVALVVIDSLGRVIKVLSEQRFGE